MSERNVNGRAVLRLPIVCSEANAVVAWGGARPLGDSAVIGRAFDFLYLKKRECSGPNGLGAVAPETATSGIAMGCDGALFAATCPVAPRFPASVLLLEPVSDAPSFEVVRADLHLDTITR